MNQMNCIIVDDEPLSRDVLKRYLDDTPGLNLHAVCKDAFEATKVLSEKRIDLIFLDINMPRLSGISFAKALSSAPMIIFTTAYPEFAVEGFELNAVDYLVKPFSFERFLKAVNRANERTQLSGVQEEQRKVLVKSDKKLYAVPLNDIFYIEGCGDYIKVNVSGKALVVHDTIKSFLENLPDPEFMRIHKSYVINLAHIKYIEGNQVFMDSMEIPVSPAFKSELLRRFSNL